MHPKRRRGEKGTTLFSSAVPWHGLVYIYVGRRSAYLQKRRRRKGGGEEDRKETSFPSPSFCQEDLRHFFWCVCKWESGGGKEKSFSSAKLPCLPYLYSSLLSYCPYIQHHSPRKEKRGPFLFIFAGAAAKTFGACSPPPPHSAPTAPLAICSPSLSVFTFYSLAVSILSLSGWRERKVCLPWLRGGRRGRGQRCPFFPSSLRSPGGGRKA